MSYHFRYRIGYTFIFQMYYNCIDYSAALCDRYQCLCVGIVQYIKNAADSKKREEGRNFMVYGVVSIFVIVSMWGLVGFLRNTFLVEQGRCFYLEPLNSNLHNNPLDS